MSMNIKNDDNEENIVAEINMTPLIDIMLVLLIIFMVSSTAALESGMDIELPKTKSTASKEEQKVMVISLNKNGDIAVQGKKVSEDNLSRTIASELKILKTDQVILEGDTKANLGKAVEIMDMAKTLGARSFSIAAENSSKN